MSEISFIKRESGLVDLSVEGGDILMGDDLHTAVGLSLFTNSRATESVFNSQVLTSNQGWWADVFRTSPLGSVLWQYYRSKKTSAVLELVRAACDQALEWMVIDGVTESVTTTASWNIDIEGLMDLEIVIQKPTGGSSVFKYQFAWDSLEGE